MVAAYNGCNRTSVELKLVASTSGAEKTLSCNRTSVELKRGYTCAGAISGIAVIEPVWN